MKRIAFLTLSVTLTLAVRAQAPCLITHTELPFVEDFQSVTDSDLFVNGCWQRAAISLVPYDPANSFADVYCDESSNRSLRMAVNHSQMPMTVALPPVDDLSDIELSFKYHGERIDEDDIYSSVGVIQIGVLEDANDPGSFVALSRVSATGLRYTFSVRLARYHGQGHNIAFRAYKYSGPYEYFDFDTTYVFIYIDSIDLHVATGCGHVENLELYNVSETQATLRWKDPEWTGNYKINLTGGGLDTTVVTTNTNLTFADLVPNTDYTVSARILCAAGEGPVVMTNFSTGGCLTPDSITVTNITDTSVLITWAPRSEETRWHALLADTNGYVESGIIVYDTATLEFWDLAPNTHYTFIVSPDCGPSSQSPWSDTIGFTTLPRATDTTDYGTNGNVEIIESPKLEAGIYPNPASGHFTVSVDRPSVVTIVDMFGRTVVSDTPVDSSLRLSTSGLSEGAYFVRIYDNNSNIVRKLVIK